MLQLRDTTKRCSISAATAAFLLQPLEHSNTLTHFNIAARVSSSGRCRNRNAARFHEFDNGAECCRFSAIEWREGSVANRRHNSAAEHAAT